MMAMRRKITTQVAKDDSFGIARSILDPDSPQADDDNVGKRPYHGSCNDQDQRKREGRSPVLDVFRKNVVSMLHPLFRSRRAEVNVSQRCSHDKNRENSGEEVENDVLKIQKIKKPHTPDLL